VKWLPNWGSNDAYLRETMFGAEHPRHSGLAGCVSGAAAFDTGLPGFGAFGTTGAHCFNGHAPAYVRIAALIDARRQYPVLRHGRQYQRQISNFGAPFALAPGGELVAWSRVLDEEEALCVVNVHGTDARGGDVLVDPALNSPTAAGNPWGGAAPFFVVVANSAQSAAGAGYSGSHAVGTHVPVHWRSGTAYVEIRDVQPSEALVLINRP